MGNYFGTDGLRGVYGENLTDELAYKLGKSVGYILKDKEEKLFIIGRDTRESGKNLESNLAKGLLEMGFNVVTVGIAPTPTVAYLIKYFKAVGGAVISASHNPYIYNGIKVFNENGFKISDEIEYRVESILDDENFDFGEIQEGIFTEEKEAVSIYADYLKSRVDADFSNLKIAVDFGNGASYKIARKLFEELGIEVISLNTAPDGKNINLNCGSTNMEVIRQAVLENDVDMGFSFDGDADRCLAVDEKGNIMDGDHILAAMAKSYKEKDELTNNAVVGTVMSNIGLKKYLDSIDVDFVPAKVGDRFVLEQMLEHDYILGAEQSGHMIFLNDSTTGDGTFTALKICELVASSINNLSYFNELMVSYPQVLVNAKVKLENRNAYAQDKEIVSEINKIEEKFSGNGRVLIRPSGTEPLVRVMIEGENQEELEVEAKKLAKFIEERLG